MRTGFGVVYSRAMLDLGLQRGAADQVGDEIDDATVTKMHMEMLDEAILVRGEVERSPATIRFEGPVVPELVPGTIQMVQDTSAVEVDVDLPWWARAFMFLRYIPLAWPVLRSHMRANPDDELHNNLGKMFRNNLASAPY